MAFALCVGVNVVRVTLRTCISIMIILGVGQKQYLLDEQIAVGDGSALHG